MDTQGTAPVAVPPQGVRDRLPKGRREDAKSPRGGDHGASSGDPHGTKGGETDEEIMPVSTSGAMKGDEPGAHVDIRI